MKCILPALAGLLCLGWAAQAQTLSPPDAYALVGVRIEVGDGRVIEKGTVLLRRGLIEAVGADLPIPPDAEVIKGDGLTVYPGFVDAQMTTGLALPTPQPDQDRPPDVASEAPAAMREANRKGIRPELRAVNHLALTETSLSPLRQAGFTTALIAPSGGMINGICGLVNLSGQPKRECVVRSEVAMSFGFTAGPGRFSFDTPSTPQPRPTGTGYPESLLGIIAEIRQTLLDAGYFHTVQEAFENGGSRRPPADDSLLALQPVLAGKMPILFDADSDNQIYRAIKLADEFDLHLILSGGSEAWKSAPKLAQRHIPVLVSLNFGDDPAAPKLPAGSGPPGGFNRPNGGGPRPNGDGPPAGRPGGRPGGGAGQPMPPQSAEDDPDRDTPRAVIAERHRKWEEQTANAAKLHQAGVAFAFTMKGTRTPTEFWTNLRQAIKAGLPRDAALQALTLQAARICGVDRQMGTVEAGKIADLIVMTGDFASPTAKVRYLFIDHSKFDIENDRTARPSFTPMLLPGEDDDHEN
ncbi:MAG TPA: amidohydrolase family protein [Chthonomonadaceae bacterium]|nr:amidohydrolase family protein [Chthonomonadaceae bacterium]